MQFLVLLLLLKLFNLVIVLLYVIMMVVANTLQSSFESFLGLFNGCILDRIGVLNHSLIVLRSNVRRVEQVLAILVHVHVVVV